jgi:hypothetical protein
MSISPSDPQYLQHQCELGQRQLMEMDYLSAAATLSSAAQIAESAGDFDTLARLLLPLQEAQRQRRQRAGEGMVCLDLLARGPDEQLDPSEIVRKFPAGQLLVAGWADIRPALEVRRLQAHRGLYLDTFLAAVYPVSDAGAQPNWAVVIVPLPDAILLSPIARNIADLANQLPPHSLILRPDDLPVGSHRATADTYGQVMDLWERLHAPFLAAADAETDPRAKIAAYTKTIAVDYACELAYQRMADVLQQLSRS